jgi:hypothetical protein
MSESKVFWRLSEDRRKLTAYTARPDGAIVRSELTWADPATDTRVEEAVTALSGRAIERAYADGVVNNTRALRYGGWTLFYSTSFGPPTWWLPKVFFERDRALGVGWLRAALYLHLTRASGGTP